MTTFTATCLSKASQLLFFVRFFSELVDEILLLNHLENLMGSQGLQIHVEFALSNITFFVLSHQYLAALLST